MGCAVLAGTEVSASEKVVGEYFCEVGTILNIGEVGENKDNPIYKIEEDGKVLALSEGSCDITLKDGSIVKVVITEASLSPESDEKDMGKINVESEELENVDQSGDLVESVQEKGIDEVIKTEGDIIAVSEEKGSEKIPESVITDVIPNASDVKEEEVTEEVTNADNEIITEDMVNETERALESQGNIIDSVETEMISEDMIEVIDKVELPIAEEEETKGYYEVEDTSTLVEVSMIGFKGDVKTVKVNKGSVKSIESSNNSVAKVVGSDKVRFNNSGTATIYVHTEGKVLPMDITSVNVNIDTSDVTVGPYDEYQIKVSGDTVGQKVKYTIESGEGCEVNGDGLVSMGSGVDAVVRVDIAGKSFRKKISATTRHEYYWNAMQQYIEQCLGTPYVFGGDAPGAGLDCSGYVSYVMRSVGLMSGRTSAQGLYNMCIPVSDPKPGDIVFFSGTYDCPDYITHVGIYAGDGCMYHSGKPNQYTAIQGYYSDHLAGYGTLISE